MGIYSFLITSLIIVLMPGTGVIYTISTGIVEGKKKSLVAAMGCTLGIVPHLVVSIALSSQLMQMNNNVYIIIRLVGACYLLYLGIGMIFSKSSQNFEQIQTKGNTPAVIRHGIMINLLNPKLTLFFFSFLPQYVSTGDGSHVMGQSIFLGLLFMLMTFIVFVGYGILADTAKNFFIHSPKGVSIIQKCFGVTFVGFAVKLALDN